MKDGDAGDKLDGPDYSHGLDLMLAFDQNHAWREIFRWVLHSQMPGLPWVRGTSLTM